MEKKEKEKKGEGGMLGKIIQQDSKNSPIHGKESWKKNYEKTKRVKHLALRYKGDTKI